jgi:cyclopropane-fatty-acyl-phospholipid synthase
MNRVHHLLRGNDLKGSVKNISAHYDLGNELFQTFLDESMTYSSADFASGAQTLEEAQREKLIRLADSVQVKPTDHVLEIGSGWGSFAIYLAKERGCRVTTVTVSRRQYEAVQAKIREAGLEGQIEILFQDYRKIEGQFDKIVSVEMLEAVGHKHLPEYFAVAERCLKESGLFGVQVITSADSRYEIMRRDVDWTQKHIFPGSLIPSLAALTDAAVKSSRFQMHSLHDLGKSYARTLAEWRTRFNANLPRIRELEFDDQFIRAWNYYFSYCEAAFETRHITVKQIVFTRPNNHKIS